MRIILCIIVSTTTYTYNVTEQNLFLYFKQRKFDLTGSPRSDRPDEDRLIEFIEDYPRQSTLHSPYYPDLASSGCNLFRSFPTMWLQELWRQILMNIQGEYIIDWFINISGEKHIKASKES